MERVWQGCVKDLPDKYQKPNNEEFNCRNVIIYQDGSRTYFNEIEPNERLNKAFSAAWNSLSEAVQLEINRIIERD